MRCDIPLRSGIWLKTSRQDHSRRKNILSRFKDNNVPQNWSDVLLKNPRDDLVPHACRVLCLLSCLVMAGADTATMAGMGLPSRRMCGHGEGLQSGTIGIPTPQISFPNTDLHSSPRDWLVHPGVSLATPYHGQLTPLLARPNPYRSLCFLARALGHIKEEGERRKEDYTWTHVVVYSLVIPKKRKKEEKCCIIVQHHMVWP